MGVDKIGLLTMQVWTKRSTGCVSVDKIGLLTMQVWTKRSTGYMDADSRSKCCVVVDKVYCVVYV